LNPGPLMAARFVAEPPEVLDHAVQTIGALLARFAKWEGRDAS